VGQFKLGGGLTFNVDISSLIVVITSLLKQNPQNKSLLLDG